VWVTNAIARLHIVGKREGLDVLVCVLIRVCLNGATRWVGHRCHDRNAEMPGSYRPQITLEMAYAATAAAVLRPNLRIRFARCFSTFCGSRTAFGDLASAQSLCDELHHFALALAETVGVRAFCSARWLTKPFTTRSKMTADIPLLSITDCMALSNSALRSVFRR